MTKHIACRRLHIILKRHRTTPASKAAGWSCSSNNLAVNRRTHTHTCASTHQCPSLSAHTKHNVLPGQHTWPLCSNQPQARQNCIILSHLGPAAKANRVSVARGFSLDKTGKTPRPTKAWQHSIEEPQGPWITPKLIIGIQTRRPEATPLTALSGAWLQRVQHHTCGAD